MTPSLGGPWRSWRSSWALIGIALVVYGCLRLLFVILHDSAMEADGE